MPSERPKPIFLRLPPDLHEWLQKRAKKTDRTMQAVIVQLITKESIQRTK